MSTYLHGYPYKKLRLLTAAFLMFVTLLILRYGFEQFLTYTSLQKIHTELGDTAPSNMRDDAYMYSFARTHLSGYGIVPEIVSYSKESGLYHTSFSDTSTASLVRTYVSSIATNTYTEGYVQSIQLNGNSYRVLRASSDTLLFLPVIPAEFLLIASLVCMILAYPVTHYRRKRKEV